jgi:hypothetical protein
MNLSVLASKAVTDLSDDELVELHGRYGCEAGTVVRALKACDAIVIFTIGIAWPVRPGRCCHALRKASPF